MGTKTVQIDTCDVCGEDLKYSDRICEVCGKDVCPMCSNVIRAGSDTPQWAEAFIYGRMCFECSDVFRERVIAMYPALEY
jgi:predicted amidophosphoribosyltransferase